MNSEATGGDAAQSLHDEVRQRFGVLPNFFRLAPENPDITANLWGFARFAYLDNPLPSLFKERLFVFLSRFCEVRYCIARHVGFLTGLGHPGGDARARPQTIDEVASLLRRCLPHGPQAEESIGRCGALDSPLADMPPPDSDMEDGLFTCAAHVFVQTSDSPRAHAALKNALGEVRFQQLKVFLAFVQTAHFWTKLHPELAFEDDVRQLLATNEWLADCLLNDPEAGSRDIRQKLALELETLRGMQREDVLSRALQAAQASEEKLRQSNAELLQATRDLEDARRRALSLMDDAVQAKDALREADRRKNEFLAMLAHELRNPLAPISNAVHVLRLRSDDSETVASASEMMDRQVGQLVRLVDDLLDVSRISRGKIELRTRRVELASVVNHAVEAARALTQCMEQELTVTLPSQPIYLNADPARLAQVVGNLLNNACKFSDKGGRISLMVEMACREHEPPEAVIRVLDSGIGITADKLPCIFDLFTQIDTSLERSTSGLGIGLTLVKSLVEMHDGTVEAYSAGVGHGCEFVVRLPIPAEKAELQPELTVTVSPLTTSRRILVVDDNLDSATSLAMLLTLTGHHTHTAYDGLEAVEAAATFRPEVVLLDIGLPKLNGYEVARRIREQPGGASVLLVALTGWGQEEDRQKSKDAGFNTHLVKPVEHSALMRILSESKPSSA